MQLLWRDRYEQMQAQFADAQQAISSEPWIWISYGINPDAGTSGPITLNGAGDDNSYHMQISASVDTAGGQGDRADLDPMLAYFENQGWEPEVNQRGSGQHWWVARAVTDEGHLFIYTVQENGFYNLALYSGVFWGDRMALAQASQERRPADWKGPRLSVPGDYVPFPEWSAPLRREEART